MVDRPRRRDVVTWRYRFEPEGTGTQVVESFEVHCLPPLARFFEDVVMINGTRIEKRP